MRDLVVTAIVAPSALLILKFLLDDIIKPLLGRNRTPDVAPTPAPVVGTTVPMPESDGWRSAYEGALRERDDEQQDHARTIDRHRVCHARMEAAGIPVPDDH